MPHSLAHSLTPSFVSLQAGKYLPEALTFYLVMPGHPLLGSEGRRRGWSTSRGYAPVAVRLCIPNDVMPDGTPAWHVVYTGNNNDNEGTVQQRTDRCASACIYPQVPAPVPYTAFQFDLTKNAGAAKIQMSEIEFKGTDGAVIDLSDCTATGPATDGATYGTAKVIDGSKETKWTTSDAALSVGSALVISCSTPKTVVKFRWATARDVSRRAHAYQCC